MRILHLLDHSVPLQSGYSFRTLAILEQQKFRGWETLQLTSSKHYGAAAAEEQVAGFCFYRTPPVPAAIARLPVVGQLDVIRRLARRTAELVRRFEPDLIHAHSPALNGVAALRVARRNGLPVVYELRALWEDAAVDHGTSKEGGVRYRLARGLENFVLRRADAITTICDGLGQEIGSRGVPPDRITVVPNGVDVSRFAVGGTPDPDLARELGLGEGPVIGFIGSFYAYEGLALLIDALPILLEREPRIKLLLVGGGPQEQELRSRAGHAGLAESVVFAGRVPHEEVHRYYDLIDVLAYPRVSIRLTELVTPLKPLEALAQEKLIVTSDVGGHRELLPRQELREMFRAGDVESLGAALLRALSRRAEWQSLKSAARRYVEEERNWTRCVARYEAVYRRVLGLTD